MLAKSDKYIQDAADSIYELTQDEKIRLQCEAREDYYRRTIDMNLKMAQTQAKIQQITEEMQQAIEEKQRAIEEMQRAIEEKQRAIEEKEQAIEENKLLRQLLHEHGIATEQKD